MAVGGILSVGSKVASWTGKAAKWMGKAAGKGAKKAGKAAKKSVKNKVKKMVGAGAFGTIGGIMGKLFSGKSAGGSAADAKAGKLGASQGNKTAGQPIPKDDPVITLEGLEEAFARAMPSLEGLESTANRSDANLSSLIIRKDVSIELDDLQEDLNPRIKAGTFISSRILELGNIHALIDNLRQQLTIVTADLDTTNENLAMIAKKLGLVLKENQKTKRDNERRRDEEEAEGKDGIGGSALLDASKAFTAVATTTLGMGILGVMGIAVGSLLLDDSDDGEEEIDDPPEFDDTGLSEEESEESILDTVVRADEETGIIGDVALGAAAVQGAGLLASTGALGSGAVAAGATVAGALAAPVAAVTGAFVGGYTAGTVLYEHTGLGDAIEGAIAAHFRGEEIDVANGTDDAAMREKYGNKQGAELLGDLLGEGYFDTAEDPEDIVSFFKKVKTYDDFLKLDDEYKAEYDRPIVYALSDALGTDGMTSIMDMLTAQYIENREPKDSAPAPKESVFVDQYGDEWKIGSVERGAPLRGAEIPSTAPVETNEDEEISQAEIDAWVAWARKPDSRTVAASMLNITEDEVSDFENASVEDVQQHLQTVEANKDEPVELVVKEETPKIGSGVIPEPPLSTSDEVQEEVVQEKELTKSVDFAEPEPQEEISAKKTPNKATQMLMRDLLEDDAIADFIAEDERSSVRVTQAELEELPASTPVTSAKKTPNKAAQMLMQDLLEDDAIADFIAEDERSSVRVARKVANQNIGFEDPLMRQGVMGGINVLLGGGDAKAELNRIIKGGVVRRKISDETGVSQSVIRESIDFAGGGGDTTRMIKAVLNNEVMPELEGETRETAQKIIPIMMPVMQGTQTIGEAAGNTAKKAIGTAVSSISTADHFLDGAGRLYS